MFDRLKRLGVPRDRLGSGLVRSVVRMCLLFLALSLVGYYSIRVFIVSESQTLSNLKAMQTNTLLLQKALVDQETGQRGYGLTGDREFLEPFSQGTQQFTEIAKRLQDQASQYPDLQQRIRDLIDKGQTWHDTFGVSLIGQVERGNKDETDALKIGKSSFDDFRATSNQVAQQLQQLQAKERAHFLFFINVMLVSLSVATVVIGTLIIWLILRRFRKMTKPINELARAVHAYSNRDFDVPVPSTTTEDELSRLFQGIDKMRLDLKKRFSAEQRRTQFSQMLVRLQVSMFKEVEFAEAAERITQELHRLIGCQHVAVFEFVEDRFRVLSSSGMDNVPNQWFKTSDTAIPAMIKRRAPSIKTNWTHQTLNVEINEYMNERLNMQATVNLPLFAENQCFA
ncbi:MAG: CHASE3 domain-containing protein, partial [Tumebacillaceae bacterium]